MREQGRCIICGKPSIGVRCHKCSGAKGLKRCSLCGETGHNKRTCELSLKIKWDAILDEVSAIVGSGVSYGRALKEE